MGLGIFLVIGVTLVSVTTVSSNIPSSLYSCIDWECEEWISQGKTMLRYMGKTDKHLSFQKNQDIQIISKPVDKNLPDWVGKVGNKVGLVPRDMVQELKMNKNPTKFKLDLQEILELTGSDNTDGQEEEDDEAEEEEEEQSSSEVDGIEIEDVELDSTDADFLKNEQEQRPKTEEEPFEDAATVTADFTSSLTATEVPSIINDLPTVISAAANQTEFSDKEEADQKTEIEPSLSTTMNTFLVDDQQQQSTDTIFHDESQNTVEVGGIPDSTPIVDVNFTSEGVSTDESFDTNQTYIEEDVQNQAAFMSSVVADPDVSSVNLQPSTDTVLQGSATIIDEYIAETPRTMVVEQNQPPLSLSVEDQITPRIPETVLLDTLTSILQNQTPLISPMSSSTEQEQQIKATRVEKSESSRTSEEEETLFALPPVEEKTREPQPEGMSITSPDEEVETVESGEKEIHFNDREPLSPGKVETLQPHKLTGNDATEREAETTASTLDIPVADTRGSKFISTSLEKETNEPPSTTPGSENGVQEDEVHSSAEDSSSSESPVLNQHQSEEQNIESTQEEKVVPEIELKDENDQQIGDNQEAAEKESSQIPGFTPSPLSSTEEYFEEATTENPDVGLEPASPPEVSQDQQQISDEKGEDQEVEDQKTVISASVLQDSEEAVTSSSTSYEIGDALEDDSINTTTSAFPSDLNVIQDEKMTESQNTVASSEEHETILVPEIAKVAAIDQSNETEPQQLVMDAAAMSDSSPLAPSKDIEDESQVATNTEGIISESDKLPGEQEQTSSEDENAPQLSSTITEVTQSVVLNEQNAVEEQHSPEASNITPPSSPVISPFDKEEKISEPESKLQEEQGTPIQKSFFSDEAVTETSTELPIPSTQEVPAEAVVEVDEQQPQQQEEHSNEGTTDHDHEHGHQHHHHHHHHHHKRFTKDFLNDSTSTSSIILVIKHLSSTLLSFLPEPLQDTILDVDDALVFTGIIALTLVSICVPYFFIEGYMSVRPLKKKVVELNKSLWKVSAAYETQQEEFEIFKRKAIAHDEFRKKAEQSENDVVILKTLEQKHREQIQCLRTQLKTQMKEAKDIRSMIEKALHDKKLVEQESSKYKQTAEKTAEALGKAKEELASFQTHVKSTALQLGMSSKSAEVLTTKITLLEQENENLKSQLVGENEKRKAQSEEMNQVSQSKIDIERELSDMKKICLQYEETVDGLNNEICKLDSELVTIKETLGEDSPLLELAEIQAKADFCGKEASSLRTRLEGVCADNENLRGKLQETETGLEETRSERDSLSKRLEVLETYFKEREEELLKTIETQQQKEMVRDKGKDELIALIEERDETIKQLNGTVDGLREELDEVNGKHRNEIRSLEAKGHESWLSLCQAERKAQDARKDAELLRQRLTAMVKENARREAEEDDDDDDSGGDGLSGQLSMMFPSVIPHELVPPPILGLDDDVDDPAPPPSYFGLGEFEPPLPLPDDDDDDEHDVEQRRRPPPLGGTRLSPSFSDMSDDDVDNNNILSPVARRRRDEECTDGSSGSGSSSPPLRSGGWINLPQQHGHRGGNASGSLRRLQSSSSRTAVDPIQPGANL